MFFLPKRQNLNLPEAYFLLVSNLQKGTVDVLFHNNPEVNQVEKSLKCVCETFASGSVFTCVCLRAAANKKSCCSLDPDGAEPCQHSQPQLI